MIIMQKSKIKKSKVLKAFMNWSGGKDSALALYAALRDPSLKVECLLTNVNSTYDRISMHGVRRSLLQQQAAAIGLPLQTVEMPEQPSMSEYEKELSAKITSLKKEGYSKAIFGDIFLEDLKHYREQQLAKVDVDCVFPLWKKDTTSIITEFIQLGFKTIVVCVNEKYLDKSFCGRVLDESFIKDLPDDVDPCGENGEFHTVVSEGPMYRNAIDVAVGQVVEREGFVFADVNPASP